MVISALGMLYVLGGLVLLCLAWLALERTWLSPRRLGKALRLQGLRGTTYRWPGGDLRERMRLIAAARSKSMPLTHDITARVDPLAYNTIKEHGKTSLVWLGPIPKVIIADPKLVREILVDKSGRLGKPPFIPNVIKLVADGLSNYEGEKWDVHRKIINPAFHVEKLKKMLPAFTACTTEMMSRWEKSILSEGPQEIDVLPEFQNLTGDAISHAAFGSSLTEGRRIFQIQIEQVQNLIEFANQMFIPGYNYLPTKVHRKMKANAREVEVLLKGIIRNKDTAMKEGHTDCEDLLGLLMQSNIKESQESGTSKLMMSMEDLIGELKLFYFAGTETTSVSLTWTMVLLSIHPEWQDHAREEVLRVFGMNQPDFNGIKQLKVVAMILYEVLRLYPPFTELTRHTFKEMELGGMRYPPGVTLSLPVMFIHHDPDLWGEDADEFKPKRFAEGISKASKDPHAFFPFGGGPRICIGQNFSLLEAKIVLSMLLQRFSFELSPSYAHAPFNGSALLPEHGAQIKVMKI